MLYEFILYDSCGRTGSITIDPRFHDPSDQVKSICSKMKFGEYFTVRLIHDDLKINNNI